MKKNILSLFLFILLTSSLLAQNASQLLARERMVDHESGIKKIDLLNDCSFTHAEFDKDWKKVDSLSRIAYKLATAAKYQLGIADALLNLSYVKANDENKTDTAISYLYVAKNIYIAHNQKFKLAITYQMLGYYSFFKKKYKENELFNKKASMLFYELRDDYRSEWLYSSNNTYFSAHTLKPGLLRFYQGIIDEYKKKNDVDAVAFFTYCLARVYATYHNTDSSFIVYRQAYQMIPKMKKMDVKAFVAMQVGINFVLAQKPDSARFYLNQAVYQSQAAHYYYGWAYSLIYLGHIEAQKQHLAKADEFYVYAMKVGNNIKDFFNQSILIYRIASFNYKMGIYSLSLKYNLKLLDLYLQYSLSEEIGKTCGQISDTYRILHEYEKAINYVKLNLEYLPKNNVDYPRGIALNQMGYLHYLDGDYQAALHFLNQADSILTVTNLQRAALVTKYWKGLCFWKMNDLDRAIALMDTTTAIKERYGIKAQTSYGTIAVNSTLARIYLQKEDLVKALKYVNQSIEDGKEDNYKDQTVLCDDYFTLYQIYKVKGDDRKALEYHEKYLDLKNQIANSESLRKITDLEIKSATEKQERQNNELKKDNQLKELAMNKQRLTSNIFIFGFLVMILFALFMYRSYKQKKQANVLLGMQKSDIQEKHEELLQLNEEIGTQKDNLEYLLSDLMEKSEELHRQKKEIEAKNKKITDSIQYAKRIQSAVMPTSEVLDAYFKDYFILFQPRDIVSGDFYFVKQVSNYLIVAVGDCTGHGVPGAFMSMLGVTLLSEIVRRKEADAPNKVLDLLRDDIKVSLKQTGKSGEQQDGMDIALCVLDLETNLLSFAGAHNPLWIFRQKSEAGNSNQIASEWIELKGDPMPVGIHPKDDRPFSCKQVQLEKNDAFYLFTDGYTSQFGGEKGDKFKVRRFQEFLQSLQSHSMEEQGRELMGMFNEWRSDRWNQVDDVLVMGIKVT